MVIAMFIKANFHKFTAALLSLAIVIVCIMLLIFSKECADGAFSGIEMCINVLIPSLFPFMAVSSFTVKSGISDFLGKPFGKIMKSVFGLSPCFAPILLLSVTEVILSVQKAVTNFTKTEMREQKNVKEQVCLWCVRVRVF